MLQAELARHMRRPKLHDIIHMIQNIRHRGLLMYHSTSK